MAKNMTSAECKFWFDILKYNEYKWLKQKIIDNYIVDFYCHKLGLVVEIDGAIHSDRKEYDATRSEFLECFGLQVLRYSNEAVLQNTFGVKADLNERIVERIENLKTKPCSKNI